MKAEEWAAIAIVTETNQPHEFLYIAWVLRNRVASSRFPDTMQAVVLQERQFSALNPWTHGRFKGKYPQEEIWHELWKTLDPIEREKLYPQALTVASHVLGMGSDVKPTEAWKAPFGPDVCWYYSPRSMVPAGTAPSWAASAERCFTPSGIDPKRFVFCEGVK